MKKNKIFLLFLLGMGILMYVIDREGEISNLQDQLDAEPMKVLESQVALNRLEKDLYDGCDMSVMYFLSALASKDLDALNALLADGLRVYRDGEDILSTNDQAQVAFLGRLSYESRGYTIHGFDYHEAAGRLTVYCQIFYQENGQGITPPTYIDLGFDVEDGHLIDLIIDGIGSDI